MILSDIAIKRPVFTTMVVLGLMSLGILAVRDIGVDLFPDVSFPIVMVTTVYPGAGPEEVEQLVTKKVEEVVSAVNGVDEVRSYSRDSVSVLVIQFKLEADIRLALNDVRDKVTAIRSNFPKDVKDPIIGRMDPTALPIMAFALSSKRGPAETRRLAEDTIAPRFEAVDGVAAVTVVGGKEREVKVYVDRAKMEAHGLSLAQLAQQIGQESFDLPAGRVTTGRSETNVKTLGRFRSLDELGNMVASSTATGAQLHLADLARIEDGYKEVRTSARLDGEDAVTLEIQKAGGTNTVAIAEQVYKVVADLQKTLPEDVKLKKVTDNSTFIRRNVDDVTESILFGGLMAILVIFIFMLDWRSTLISSLALPTSVITTFLVMSWMHFTFNIMSLLAISLSIGLLIDDAVVVRENIYRHMEKGEDPINAARKGTAEIGLAVMATTFTIVAVFVPVGFMGGLIGRMFRQFGLTVAVAVLVSLFISFTLDPMMSARVMKPISKNHKEELKHSRFLGPIARFYERLDGYYRGILAWSLAHKWVVALGATLLFFGSLGLIPFMGKEFVPPADRGEFRVNLEMPAGTSFAEMDRVTAEAEKVIRENKEVKSLFTTVGPGEEVNKGTMKVITTKWLDRRPLTQWDIQNDLRARLARIPALKFDITDLGLIEGPGVEKPIVLYVRGDDYAVLQRVATEATEAVRTTRGTRDGDQSFRAGKPETNIRVDRSKAADLGVSLGTVAMTARLALEGDVVAKYRQGDRDYDVRMQLTPEDRASLRSVEELTVPATGRRVGGSPGAGGPGAMAAMMAGPRLVRVSDVAQVQGGSGPGTIERMNRQRQIIVTANLSNRAAGDVVADIEQKIAAIDKPAGFSFAFGSMTQRMKETFANMTLALLIAAIFIYLVLASQFESFIHPFTIMLAMPLALVGALLGLFLANWAIGMAAMIGIILLMGLVTKNAILLVDYTNTLRDQGLSMTDALLQAGPTRLRPILMTSAAMVLGMLPTAIGQGEGSEFRAPMAIAVIGGVITSTLLTLIVVPVVYTWMDKLTLRGSREKKARRVEEASEESGEAERPTAQPAAFSTLGAGGEK